MALESMDLCLSIQENASALSSLNNASSLFFLISPVKHILEHLIQTFHLSVCLICCLTNHWFFVVVVFNGSIFFICRDFFLLGLMWLPRQHGLVEGLVPMVLRFLYVWVFWYRQKCSVVGSYLTINGPGMQFSPTLYFLLWWFTVFSPGLSS